MLLTDREREVAVLIAKGYKDEEIADRLDISRRRVCEMVSSIKEKWDIGSRVEIGVLAYQIGWICDPQTANIAEHLR
ncbi:response regulator transcription factor [Desmospora profundinema]|uniref:NarL family two-component system response regulator LiaR n=1 Tax=Desmospora profundinema TaxID=1571184 RepID=A0ABU1IQC7_9BACL|nr:NarL family two-component system response regulator LiaR [Desmospora profundinema]